MANMIDRDSTFRHHGELLLRKWRAGPVSCDQLAVYGTKQAKPGTGRREQVLRDLEPVLKRIAGDDIELVLPKTSSRSTSMSRRSVSRGSSSTWRLQSVRVCGFGGR